MTTEGLLHAGPVVVVSGPAARACLDCVAIAVRTRRQNGLPNSSVYLALAEALRKAVSAYGHWDVREAPVVQHVEHPMTVKEAADMLNRSTRQITRLAERLGGRKIGGRWLLDAQAVREHEDGTRG